MVRSMMRLFKTSPRRQAVEISAAVRESTRLRYGGPWFSAASALPLTGLLRSGRWATLVAAALRRPWRLVALVLLLLRTRSEHVFLSESVAGQCLRAYLSRRSLGVIPRNRLCRGVLLLPRDHSDYVRGHRRQALRTNLRRAAAAGITCDVMKDRSRALDELLERFRRRGASQRDLDGLTAMVALPEMTLMVAQDKSGCPLAHAGVVIDDTVCLIWRAMASSHEARWALHDYLVRTLIARGVRYLLCEGGGPFGALGFSTNIQHYQHLLGYELRHLIPAKPHSMRRRPRLLGALAVTAVTAATLIMPPAAASAGVIHTRSWTQFSACTSAQETSFITSGSA